MNANDAIAVVEGQRRELKISRAMKPQNAERAIVLFRPSGASQGPGSDRIAWIVTLTSAMGFVCVDVDDTSGEVLDVRRSA
jgi:hypothetical protein